MQANRKRCLWIRTSLQLAFVFLAAAVFCWSQGSPGSAASNGTAAESARLGTVVQTQHGERCIVCNKPLGPGDPTYLVDGQRVAVHSDCESSLRQDLGHYLDALRPRGAFLGAEPKTRAAASWMWAMVAGYVLLGLLFGGLCSYRALNGGLRPVRWFVLGFFLNILAFLVLLARSGRAPARGTVPRGLVKIPRTHAPRSCPGCGKLNHPSAGSCASCGSRLEPAVASEIAKAGLHTG